MIGAGTGLDDVKLDDSDDAGDSARELGKDGSLRISDRGVELLEARRDSMMADPTAAGEANSGRWTRGFRWVARMVRVGKGLVLERDKDGRRSLSWSVDGFQDSESRIPEERRQRCLRKKSVCLAFESDGRRTVISLVEVGE